MSGIMGQFDTSDVRGALLQLADQLPRLVLRTVVDIDDETVSRNFLSADEFIQQSGQTVVGLPDGVG